MKKIIKLKESELNDIIKQSIKEFLTETNLIRRLRDDEYPEEQLDLDDLSIVKNKNYKAYKSIANNLDKPLNKDNINNVQQNLTNSIQGKLKQQGKSLYVNPKEINMSKTALRKLDKNGIKIEIKGETFSYGNSKIPPSTMIINLTSAFNCPSTHCPSKKRMLCQKK